MDAHPGSEDMKGREDGERSSSGREWLRGGPLTGPISGHNQPPFGISAPPTAARSQAADRVLLDAFLSVRSRTRGPLVAVNERTMITNLGASELLQPADRRLLWEHVATASSDPGETTVLALYSGVEVRVSAQLVGGQLSPKGAVLHLSVELPVPRGPARGVCGCHRCRHRCRRPARNEPVF